MSMAGGNIINLTPTTAPGGSGLTSSSHYDLITAYDVLERFLSFMGANPTLAADRDVRRAIISGIDELATVHPWKYYITLYRIDMQGIWQSSVPTATYAYTQANQQLALTGDTWPTWIVPGYSGLYVGTSFARVKAVLSSTVLQLDAVFNPGADIAATDATTLTVFQDLYALPVNFSNGGRGLVQNNWGGMSYAQPHDMLSSIRYMATFGQPALYTFLPDPAIPGRLALQVYPPPDATNAPTLDFVYQRRMRPVKTFDASTGTCTVTNGGTAVTLAGGSFLPVHAGAVMRLGTDGKNKPTGIDGPFPYGLERTISAVNSTTSVTLDAPADVGLAGVTYRISDPIDMEIAMRNVYYATVQKHLARVRNFKPAEIQAIDSAWMMQLNLAKEADDRNSSREAVELWGTYRMRLRDMPRGPDIS